MYGPVTKSICGAITVSKLIHRIQTKRLPHEQKLNLRRKHLNMHPPAGKTSGGTASRQPVERGNRLNNLKGIFKVFLRKMR